MFDVVQPFMTIADANFLMSEAGGNGASITGEMDLAAESPTDRGEKTEKGVDDGQDVEMHDEDATKQATVERSPAAVPADAMDVDVEVAIPAPRRRPTPQSRYKTRRSTRGMSKR